MEYNRPFVIYIVCCRGESHCTFIYFICHLQLSVDGQGSGEGWGREAGRRCLRSHYKTVRSSAKPVIVFVIEAARMNCKRPTHGSRICILSLSQKYEQFRLWKWSNLLLLIVHLSLFYLIIYTSWFINNNSISWTYKYNKWLIIAFFLDYQV